MDSNAISLLQQMLARIERMEERLHMKDSPPFPQSQPAIPTPDPFVEPETTKNHESPLRNSVEHLGGEIPDNISSHSESVKFQTRGNNHRPKRFPVERGYYKVRKRKWKRRSRKIPQTTATTPQRTAPRQGKRLRPRSRTQPLLPATQLQELLHYNGDDEAMVIERTRGFRRGSLGWKKSANGDEHRGSSSACRVIIGCDVPSKAHVYPCNQDNDVMLESTRGCGNINRDAATRGHGNMSPRCVSRQEHMGYRLTRCSDAELRIWVNCFEEYLFQNNITGDRMMQVVYQSLEGPTGLWIQGLWETHSPGNWAEFKGMIQQATKPVKQTSQSRYLGIHQTGSVRKYRDEFEALCSKSVSLPRKYLEEVFLLGLKPQLQDAVRLSRPQSLIQMMDVAQWLEESEEIITSRRVIPSVIGILGNEAATNAYTELHRVLISSNGTSAPEQLMSLTTVRTVAKPHKKEPEIKDEGTDWEELFEQSSVTDCDKDKRLKVYGFISGHNVAVLIDSGATNNFMSKALAIRLKLSIRVEDKALVCLGHGRCSYSEGVCFGVSLVVQDTEIIEDYLLLDLNQPGVDLILGNQWLANLEDTWINWKEKTISFFHDTSWFTIKGKKGEWKQKTGSDHKLSVLSKPWENTGEVTLWIVNVDLIMGNSEAVERSEVEPRKKCEIEIGYHLEDKVGPLRGNDIPEMAVECYQQKTERRTRNRVQHLENMVGFTKENKRMYARLNGIEAAIVYMVNIFKEEDTYLRKLLITGGGSLFSLPSPKTHNSYQQHDKELEKGKLLKVSSLKKGDKRILVLLECQSGMEQKGAEGVALITTVAFIRASEWVADQGLLATSRDLGSVWLTHKLLSVKAISLSSGVDSRILEEILKAHEMEGATKKKIKEMFTLSTTGGDTITLLMIMAMEFGISVSTMGNSPFDFLPP